MKTLDNKEWEVSTLEEKMIQDEFYYGYMGRNSLSSSSVKKLLESPRAYLDSISKQQEDIDAFKFGRLIHEQLLEPDVNYHWNVVEAKDKRSKAWKDAVKENIPNTILERDYNYCMNVVQNVKDNDSAFSELFLMDTEVPKVGLIDGVPFRAKADAISMDRDKIVDLKTTGDISKFNKWTAMSYGYDCQVYIYCTLFDVDYSDFRFLVVDKNTGVCGKFDVSEAFYNSGAEKVHRAIDMYKQYFIDNTKDVKNYLIHGEL